MNFKKLPKTNFVSPKSGMTFLFNIDNIELTVKPLITYATFEGITENTSQKFVSKTIVEIIKNQQYFDYIKKFGESMKHLNTFALSVKDIDLLRKNGVQNFDNILCIETFSLESFHDIIYVKGLNIQLNLPFLYEGTLVLIKGIEDVFAVDKSSTISFNYLTGAVSYSIALKTLINGVICGFYSLNEIDTVLY